MITPNHNYKTIHQLLSSKTHKATLRELFWKINELLLCQCKTALKCQREELDDTSKLLRKFASAKREIYTNTEPKEVSVEISLLFYGKRCIQNIFHRKTNNQFRIGTCTFTNVCHISIKRWIWPYSAFFKYKSSS